jgi:hypothetical protein
MEIVSTGMVLFFLVVLWAGVRLQRRQGQVMVTEQVETLKNAISSSVDHKAQKKTQKLNRQRRRRMAWARRRLVLYPERSKYTTKRRALNFIRTMLTDGPVVLKRQALAILKEMDEVNSPFNSVYLILDALHLLEVHDSRWYNKQMVPAEQVRKELGLAEPVQLQEGVELAEAA